MRHQEAGLNAPVTQASGHLVSAAIGAVRTAET